MASSDREQAERIRAIYGNVPAGAAVMLLAVATVAAGVLYLAPARTPQLLLWISVGLAVLMAQFGLWAWRKLSQPADSAWRVWAWRLMVVCLADGARWGWATVWLAGPGQADLQVWVCMIVGGAACASVASWGNYHRIYYCMMLPAMVPYVIWAATASDPAYWGVAVLGGILTCALAWLSGRQSRAFADAVRLRFENLDLAESLREQKELAEQANLAKSQFLAAASHDLRQPVHALGLLVAALSRTRLPRDGQRLTGQISEAVEAMGGLFASLLDLSQLDAGTITPMKQPFAIGPLLTRLCREEVAELAGRPVALRQAPCGAVVDTDPVLLERMLRNLISNAARYTQRGRILVGCRHRGGRLSVQVWDTGPGIAPAHQAQVFQEYYQVSNPERDRNQGLGLGLAITRRLSILLDCPIALRSEPGRGAMFSIDVPLATDAARPVALEAATPAAPRQGLVFVIDDEALIQQSMSQLLGVWGYQVVAAGSAEELLALADPERRPDLLVCDWRLRGGETGAAAIGKVAAVYGDVPALLITGDTAPDRLRAANETGLVLLHKPVSPGKLRAALGNLIGRRAATPEPAAEIRRPG